MRLYTLSNRIVLKRKYLQSIILIVSTRIHIISEMLYVRLLVINKFKLVNMIVFTRIEWEIVELM